MNAATLSRALGLQTGYIGYTVKVNLEGLSDEFLAREAPAFPGGESRDTMGALLTGLVFHEAYHAGQLGVLRRVSGNEGAIK